jgi:hypothetical protein
MYRNSKRRENGSGAPQVMGERRGKKCPEIFGKDSPKSIN